MSGAVWLYALMLTLYASSLLLYFSDFASKNARIKRLGTWLLVFVWVMQSGFLLHRVWSHWNVTAFSLYENLLIFSWLLISFSLLLSLFFMVEIFVFITNVIGFSILAINVTDAGHGTSFAAWDVAREMLYIHVALIIFAYVLLIGSAIFAGSYVFLHGRLKEKRWTDMMRRLPSLDTIERLMKRFMYIGFGLLVLSMSVALTSLFVERQYWLLMDVKVIISLVAVALYSVTVYLSRTKLPIAQVAFMILVSFGVMLVNLFFVNNVSSFHGFS